MIFVFGSNLDGIHGAGAARHAMRWHGAVYGQGDGLHGHSYAIPTKGHGITDMALDQIEPYIARFLDFAKANQNMTFMLTPIGTGLAGHAKRDIWAILERYGVPRNVYLASTWVTE